MKRALAVVALFAVGCMPKGGEDYNKGIEAFKAKDYEKAKGLFEKAVQANPEFAEAWHMLAAAKIRHAKKLAEDGKNAEAFDALKSGHKDGEKAKGLMDQGKWLVYKEPGEQNRVKQRAEESLAQIAKAVESEATAIGWLRTVQFTD